MNNELKIKYIGHLGSDKDVVLTSRVCTAIDKELNSASIRRNIENLMRDGHWSCFEHQFISYMIEVPIYVARQWMRHQQKYMEKEKKKKATIYLGYNPS